MKPFKKKNSTNSRYFIFSKDLGLSIISKKQETLSFYARSMKVGICAKSNKLGMHEEKVGLGTIEGNIASGKLTFGTFLINVDYSKFNPGQPRSTKVAKTVN